MTLPSLQSGSAPPEWGRRLLLTAVLLAAGLGVYWPALQGGWIWDDALEIVENPALRTAAGLRSIWLAPSGPDYFPLTRTVQWLEWHWWGLHPFGYHAVSLGLHLVSAGLLWRLLERWRVRWAWGAALLWVVHPVAVESVAWIAELKNTLSLALLLVAMLAYTRNEQSQEQVERDLPPSPELRRVARARLTSNRVSLWSPDGVALVCFTAALLSKTSVVLFPLMLLAYHWWRFGRITRRAIIASLPFFLCAGVLGAVTVHFQHTRALAGMSLDLGSLPARLARSGAAAAFYASEAFWPRGLMTIYPRWPARSMAWVGVAAWAVLLLLAALLWSRRATGGRTGLFILGAFVLSVAPILGLVSMAYLRIAWVADHFGYVALVPTVAALAGALGAWAARGSAAAQRWIQGLLGALVLAGMVEARVLAARYRDAQTFWTAAVACNPDSWYARTNLGTVRFAAGDIAGALAELVPAAQRAPDSAETRNDLGAALAAAGQPAASLTEYQAAVHLAPRNPQFRNNLGTALIGQGQTAAALGEFSAAVDLQPGFAVAHQNRGLALSRLGRRTEAVAEFEEALHLDPQVPEARRNLALAHAGEGEALGNAGRLEQAAAEFEAAIRWDPSLAAAHRDLALALRALGRPADAARELELARRLAGHALK